MTWYHGSQENLSVLRVGSSITESEAIARAFSHRPAIVSLEEDGTVRHSGTTPGFLYEIAEGVADSDIYPHPHPVNASKWEWLTRRALRLRLLERTLPRPEDLLTPVDVEDLERLVADSGQSGSAVLEEPRR